MCTVKTSLKSKIFEAYFNDKEVQTIKIWCERQDLNLHGCPPDPKSGASANFATLAYRIYYSTSNIIPQAIFITQ